MAYARNPQWKNYPDASTPITAEKLENIENGIVGAVTDAAAAISSAGNAAAQAASALANTSSLLDAAHGAQEAATAAAAAAALAAANAARVTGGVNPNDVGYDVILLAGQSNMSGRGAGYDNAKLDPVDPRIFQYGNSTALANKISVAIEPLLMHDTPSGMGPGLQFARWYSQMVPANRRVLLVPVAHGGTGFRTTTVTPTPVGYTTPNSGGGTWEVGGDGVNLYENAIAQANGAIAAAGANARIVAILWLQGENDTGLLDQAGYASELDQLIDGFRSRITGAANVPFIVGQMLPEMTTANPSWAMINSAHVDTPRRKTRAAYAYGLAGANNGDNLHYNADGARFMGRSMFEAYSLAVGNVTGVAPLPPSSLNFAQTATSLTVTWGRPACRFTDFVLEYEATGSGTWLAAPARTNALDNFVTLTGLTLGGSYDFRVKTVNEMGPSGYTTATFQLATIANPPTGLSATGAGTSLNVSWSAAAGATSYQMEHKLTTDSTWTTDSTVSFTSGVINGLTPSTNYDVRVRSVNAAGTGSPSATLTVGSGATGPSLLDGITATPARAYSLRRLKSTYAGSAVRVRRASDNAEADIAFIGNDFDTSTLAAFAAGSDVFIKTWYDQSGNARHLTQATGSAQAKIATAGTVQTLGARPAASFGSAYYSGTSPSMWAAGSGSVLTVLSGNAAGSAVRVFAEGSSTDANPQFSLLGETATTPFNNGIVYVRGDSGATVFGSTTANTGPGIWTGTAHQVSVVDTGSVASQWVDGAAGYTTGAYTRTGTLTLNRFTLGAMERTTVGSFFAGLLPEFLSWNAALSTVDRQAGEANQKAYYGTP